MFDQVPPVNLAHVVCQAWLEPRALAVITGRREKQDTLACLEDLEIWGHL